MKHIYIHISTLLVCTIISFGAIAQENCSNGIDDDGDGNVDLNDNECVCNGFSSSGPLLSNPSFESYNQCPTNLSQVDRADHWVQTSDGSSDYYNYCHKLYHTSGTNDPYPLPDGDGIMGFWNTSNEKEYISQCLPQPLAIGETYSFSADAFTADISNFASYIGENIVTTPSGGTLTIDLFSSYSPGSGFNLTLYGVENCTDMTFSGSDCPTTGSANYIELGSVFVPYQTDTWQNVNFSFTAPSNIGAIAIGGGCSDVGSYYYVDNLVLDGNTTSNPPVALTQSGNYCVGNIELTANPPVISNPTYQWYQNGVAINGETSTIYDVPNGESGDYQIMVSNADGCVLSDPEAVSSSAIDVVNTPSNSTCGLDNGEINVNVLNGNAPYTYSIDGNIATGNSITGLAAGTYTIEVEDDDGCTISELVTISNVGLISGTIGVNGNDAVVNITSDLNPVVITLNGNVEPDANFDDLPNGTYQVIITDPNGCEDVIDFVINVPPTPCTIDIDTVIDYSQNNIDITHTGAIGAVQFYLDDQWQAGSSLAGLADGTYEVKVIDASGCKDSAVVTFPTLPPTPCTIDIDTVIDYSQNNIDITHTGAIGVVQFYLDDQWQAGSSLAGLADGTYEVKVIDASGCKDSAVVIFSTLPPTPCTLDIDTLIDYNLNNIAVTHTGANGTVQFFLDDVLQTTGSFNGLPEGTYEVKVIDANGCKDSVLVTFKPIVIPNCTPYTISSETNLCLEIGQNTHLANVASGGLAPYSYHWNNDSYIGDEYDYPLGPNTESFDVFAVDADGCHSDTLYIQINPKPNAILQLSETKGCEPLCLEIEGSTTLSDANVQEIMFLSEGISATDNHALCYHQFGDFEFSMVVKHTNGCTDTTTENIEVYPRPTADFLISPQVEIELFEEISFINKSTHADYFTWNLNDEFMSYYVQPTLIVEDTGHFSISLMVENEYECKDTVQKEIFVHANTDLFIANAFSPDGDGINDCFAPVLYGELNTEFYSFTIFDRSSNEVFHTEDQTDCWDGISNGKAQTSGIYPYQLSYLTHMNEKRRVTGFVVLVR